MRGPGGIAAAIGISPIIRSVFPVYLIYRNVVPADPACLLFLPNRRHNLRTVKGSHPALATSRICAKSADFP